MKIFERNEIVKKILIIFIAITMTTNFVMPNYVQAASAGEKLVSGLFYLIAKLGDVGISLMQKYMTGEDEPINGNNMNIKYSPGMIFANKVPLLDINFITPHGETITIDDGETTGVELKRLSFSSDRSGIHTPANNIIYKKEFDMTSLTSVDAHTDALNSLLEQYGYNTATDGRVSEETYNWTANGIEYELTDISTMESSRSFKKTIILKNLSQEESTETGETQVDAIERTKNEWLTDYGYYAAGTTKIKESETLEESIYEWKISSGKTYSLKEVNTFGTNPETILTLSEITVSAGTTINSPASALQGNIATWYKALRTIALVGLLSVLVYLGIRIILSSASAQDKAKYKNMLKDWLVAICILFLLHYAMALMLQATEKINAIISVGMDSSDPLMSSIREKVGDSYDDANIGLTAGYTVMYLALVILTGVFTFQYLKRVIYVAFLTMIAPMIALTYPLDKVKDGKAQAFSFWLREYIFNCLIQPVHLLLYTVLITSSIGLAENNILYAIVALGFLVPAEKFIKKMFGLDSQSPVGTLSAAAGGAMVMSMLNKIKGKPPKGGTEGAGSGGASNPKGVRTATANNNSGGTSSNGSNSGNANNGGANNTTGGNRPIGGANNSGGNNPVANNSGATGTVNPSIGRGLKNAGKNMAIKGVDSIKSTSGKLIKAAPGAILGGTIGLAATVASGGENATTFIGGGIAAGSALSSNVAGGIKKLSKDTYADYQKGKYGIEAYNNRKLDKEFYKSEGYKQIAEDTGLLSSYGGEEGIKNATKSFLENGITDASQIKKAMQAGVTGEDYKAFSDIGVTNAKEMAKAKTNWGSPEIYAMAKKAAPIAKNKTKSEFIAMANDMGIAQEQAKKIYENMLDLL